jgi:hypothetical protein
MKMLSLLKNLSDSKNGVGDREKADDEVFSYVMDLYERVAMGGKSNKLGSMQDVEALNECVLFLLSRQISKSL